MFVSAIAINGMKCHEFFRDVANWQRNIANVLAMNFSTNLSHLWHVVEKMESKSTYNLVRVKKIVMFVYFGFCIFYESLLIVLFVKN